MQSVGFWPGGGGEAPMFYAYAYPQPSGFPEAPVPAPGAWRADLGEFVLPLAALAERPDPDAVLRDFFQAAYEAAADLGHWDRGSLERPKS